MSDPAQLLSLRKTLSGRWQIPVLIAGGLTLAAGIAKMVRDSHATSFEEQVSIVNRLRQAKAPARASAYLMEQLGRPGRPPAQRGELARLLAQVIYGVEAELSEHNPANVRAVITNFHHAQRYGAELAPEDWDALADAYGWAKNRAEAADAYRQALRLSVASPNRVRRKLLDLLSDAGDKQEPAAPSITPEVLGHLDAMLASETISPAEYYWALDREVQWCLSRRETARAMELVEAARGRLVGTEEQIALAYLDGLCLYQSGRSDAAEARLRELRDAWTARDELWGQAGWLLGKIQQEENRPQAALAFFEDVLKSFLIGRLHDLCRLGQAECLAALERFDAAYDVFAELAGRAMAHQGESQLDLEAMRTSIATIGESLLQVKMFDAGIKYLELALKGSEKSSRAARAHRLTRIAEAFGEMARQARSSAANGRAEGRAGELFARAGEMHAALASMDQDSEDVAARLAESAFADFEAAGLSARMIEVLQHYAAKHPDGVWRSTALFKLGQTHQRERRYHEAIATYDEVIKTYPRMPDALRSVVPLAECLLAAGREKDGQPLRARGVGLLIGIVDDRGAEQLFGPSATEYRDALFHLAEYYSHANDVDLPDHFEQAISRWEDWLALYRDEPRETLARFMLADASRQSGQALRAADASRKDEAGMLRFQSEANARLALAQQNYEKVIAHWAPRDSSSLTAIEDAYLRASYLYRADCLFDLGRYAQAVAAYREATWRYENLPAGISASMQIVHALRRMEQVREATAALARVRWLLAKIPDSLFEADRGSPGKAYWQAMVQRLETAGLN